MSHIVKFQRKIPSQQCHDIFLNYQAKRKIEDRNSKNAKKRFHRSKYSSTRNEEFLFLYYQMIAEMSSKITIFIRKLLLSFEFSFNLAMKDLSSENNYPLPLSPKIRKPRENGIVLIKELTSEISQKQEFKVPNGLLMKHCVLSLCHSQNLDSSAEKLQDIEIVISGQYKQHQHHQAQVTCS